MNPFLTHPILQFVGYEMMKRPTLEGIKADLRKNIYKPSIKFITIYSSFFCLYGLSIFIRNDTLMDILSGFVFFIIGIGYIIVWKIEKQKKIKRFKISDKEILEQIEIHKEWNMPKS